MAVQRSSTTHLLRSGKSKLTRTSLPCSQPHLAFPSRMSTSSLLSHLSSQSFAPASHALSVLPQTVSLLQLHSPFSPSNSASPLPPAHVAFIKTVDAYVLGKDVEGRLVGWTIARLIVEQGGADILEIWGRSWVVGLMPLVGVSSTPSFSLNT